MKFYNILAVSSRVHGCETQTLNRKDKRRLNTAEMKFKRDNEGRKLKKEGRRRNENSSEELDVDLKENKLGQCKQNW
jgi:hypothetical protein